MTADEARFALAQLIDDGWLIGVEVFGAHCCDDIAGCTNESGFGLCDTFSSHACGSDCNRAEKWLMRPSDTLMGSVTNMLHDGYDEGFTPAP